MDQLLFYQMTKMRFTIEVLTLYNFQGRCRGISEGVQAGVLQKVFTLWKC